MYYREDNINTAIDYGSQPSLPLIPQEIFDQYCCGEPYATPDYVRDLYGATDAENYIQSIRVPRLGAISIEETAAAIGIPVVYDSEPGPRAYLSGTGPYKGQPIEIGISTVYDVSHQSVSFAHEIGHYFMDEIIGIDREPDDIGTEVFCDYFGRQMALGLDVVKTVETVDEELLMQLAETYMVELEDVIYQLVEGGKLPSHVAIDGRLGNWKNAAHSFRVVRNVVCFAKAFDGNNQECPATDSENIPVFDFTIHGERYATAITSCLRFIYEGWSKETTDKLTAYYNRKHGFVA